MPAPEPLISFERVTAGYRANSVVREVSLTVAAGEVVGLVGPNGSGKTTLVRVASRALRPSSGRVTVAGRDPYRLPGKEAARLVAVVPQDLHPAFSFTALELVLMGRAPYVSPLGGGGPLDWARTREAMAESRCLTFRRAESAADRHPREVCRFAESEPSPRVSIRCGSEPSAATRRTRNRQLLPVAYWRG